MAQANWWEDDEVVGGTAPAAPATPTYPGVIPGRQKQPTPIELEDQEMERERLRLAQEASDRANATSARAAETAAMGSDAERTAGFLTGRIVDAAQRLAGAAKQDRSAMAPTLGVEAARKVLGDTAANYLTDPERQQIRAAQIDILDAGLTLGTGAAYTREQIEGYREVYFPQLGDDPATIRSKQEALRSLLVNARTKAGRAAPELDAALAAIDSLSTPETNGGDGGEEWTREKSIAYYGREYITEDGQPLGPDGGWAQDVETGEWSLTGRLTDDGQPTPVESEAAKLDQLTGKLGVTDLAGQGIMLGLGDEAAGVGKALATALTGDFDVAGNYKRGRDVQRLRLDQTRDELGWMGTAAEVVGGGALGKIGGGFNSLMQTGRSVAARGVPITRSAIQGQMARNAAQEGATVGALGGYGYGEGLEGSTSNAVLGGAGGGVLGLVGQKIGNAVANRPSSQVAGAQVQRAADDLQIPVIPAVTGGTTARRLTGGARQGFISDRPIAGAVNRMEEAGGAARDRTAAATGRVLDNEGAGNIVRQAANVYSKRTSEIGGKLYRRADRMAAGTRLPLPNAVAKADEWLASLAKSAEGVEGSLYKDVKKLRDQMASRDFEVEGIRQTRTALREQIQERGLRGSATDKVFGEILEEATGDLFDGLSAAGKDNAAGALRTANTFWRKRVETIDEVLDPILGKNAPRSGEQIVSAVERLANPKTGNAAQLRRLFDAMPKEEARSVAATIISRMGQPTSGAAQTGGGFSFDTFLTNWNKLSPRARSTIFPAESRKALDSLATVSVGVKRAGAATNTSNTAGAVGVQAVISAPLLWLGDPLTIVAATGGQWAVGRLLASPRVARWIATAPKNPQARASHIARLGGIARAEPALANEIGLLQRAANDNLGNASRLAAEEPSEEQQR